MLTERAPHLLNIVSENLKFLEDRAVGIDIDGTTQATYILALKKASLGIGKVISKDHLKSYWELSKIAESYGMSKEEALSFNLSAWNHNDVYLNAPEMLGIRSLLEVFNEIKIPYFFISSRPAEFDMVTKEWFKKTLPWIPAENIILGRKDGVHGGDFKAEMIKKYNVGLFIEDATEEAVVIADKGKIPVLLVPQPWNDNDKIYNQRMKHLGDYDPLAGAWPILRFLVKNDAKVFFNNVAHSY